MAIVNNGGSAQAGAIERAKWPLCIVLSCAELSSTLRLYVRIKSDHFKSPQPAPPPPPPPPPPPFPLLSSLLSLSFGVSPPLSLSRSLYVSLSLPRPLFLSTGRIIAPKTCWLDSDRSFNRKASLPLLLLLASALLRFSRASFTGWCYLRARTHRESKTRPWG